MRQQFIKRAALAQSLEMRLHPEPNMSWHRQHHLKPRGKLLTDRGLPGNYLAKQIGGATAQTRELLAR